MLSFVDGLPQRDLVALFNRSSEVPAHWEESVYDRVRVLLASLVKCPRAQVLVDAPCTTDRDSIDERNTDISNIFHVRRKYERLQLPDKQQKILMYVCIAFVYKVDIYCSETLAAACALAVPSFTRRAHWTKSRTTLW